MVLNFTLHSMCVCFQKDPEWSMYLAVFSKAKALEPTACSDYRQSSGRAIFSICTNATFYIIVSFFFEMKSLFSCGKTTYCCVAINKWWQKREGDTLGFINTDPCYISGISSERSLDRNSNQSRRLLKFHFSSLLTHCSCKQQNKSNSKEICSGLWNSPTITPIKLIPITQAVVYYIHEKGRIM